MNAFVVGESQNITKHLNVNCYFYILWQAAACSNTASKINYKKIAEF